MRAEIKAVGVVQGVGFRPFIYRTATSNHLKGYVRNRGDAGVEIVVEGKKRDIDHFLKALQTKKPPLAIIHKLHLQYSKATEEFHQFAIRQSSNTTELSGSVIPPDIALCNECLRELRDPANPRYKYFFITCTDCGPRYTTIRQLPYDRHNTTMDVFEACPFCKTEYTTPSNRRFHAQTVACPNCGPKAYLTTRDGELLSVKEPISEAGRLLEEGYTLAIKGYGGFHVSTATTRDEPILRLRKAKHRTQKPFAIMARDLTTIGTFAQVNNEEARILSSYVKPIVLLDKSEDYYLSELIAPRLHNVGVMLSYTGLHEMLFDKADEPAFVMTSANPPSEPIVNQNAEALKKLGSTVDYFLFHDRAISQRCDDSVIRLHDSRLSIIRRSRGYAPAPIKLKYAFDSCVLGVGAKESVTAYLVMHDKAFGSQHIGDVENLETLLFLKKTIHHLTRLTNAKIDIVTCDLHPQFATTNLAREVATEMNCPLLPVQHHHAHLLSLMGEHGLDEILGIVCDGYGYGENGNAWGGEILHCTKDGYQRLAHLQPQPMIGGDLATRYPLRMAAGMLGNTVDVDEWLLERSKLLPHRQEEAHTILNQLNNQRTPTTTSCGRVLDAVAAILDICHERTYQGEPAMKLESAATSGQDVLRLEPAISDGILLTSNLVRAVFQGKERFPIPDLAHSAQLYLARGLAQLALQAARSTGVNVIGFSGGVAYNKHMAATIGNSVAAEDGEFYVHEALPAGDGGIALGQALAGAFSTRNRN